MTQDLKSSISFCFAIWNAPFWNPNTDTVRKSKYLYAKAHVEKNWGSWPARPPEVLAGSQHQLPAGE